MTKEEKELQEQAKAVLEKMKGERESFLTRSPNNGTKVKKSVQR